MKDPAKFIPAIGIAIITLYFAGVACLEDHINDTSFITMCEVNGGIPVLSDSTYRRFVCVAPSSIIEIDYHGRP